MIYARHNPKDNTYRFFYADNIHTNVEVLRIENKGKTKGFVIRPLFNKKPHKISFVQNWLPMTLEFSKNTLVLKNYAGETYFDFDARGEKPVMKINHRNNNIFIAPEQGKAKDVGITYIDNAKGHRTRAFINGIIALSKLMANGYAQMEEGIPVQDVKNPKPSKIIAWGKLMGHAVADAISILEDGKPFNAYKSGRIKNHVRQ